MGQKDTMTAIKTVYNEYESTGLPRIVLLCTNQEQKAPEKILEYIYKNSRYIPTFGLAVGKPLN